MPGGPAGGLSALVVGGLVATNLPTVDEAAAWLSGFPAWAVLLVITVTGELAVMAAVVVAVQGSWSLAEVVLWCFVGTVGSDAAWFRLAGAVGNRWLTRREPGPREQQVMAWLRRRTGERPYLALLFVKFLYGSRFLMIVYVATRGVSLRRFLVYDAVGTAAWLAVLVPLGWLVAVGVVTATAAGRLDLLVLATVVLIVVLRGGAAWITARATRRSLPS